MERTQVEQETQRREESAAAQAARQAVQGVSDNATRFVDSLRATAGKLSASVSGVPIPGDLLLPLSILLLFFFALVVINGHTRLSWLWLVLSGNASIMTGQGGSFSQPIATTPPVTPLSTILPFAGVGEPT
jgi:Flp pilus assembly protein TadB